MTDLALLSAETLTDLYRRGIATPVDALQATTERIARHNPAINAFALLDPGAPEAARASTQRWHAGRPLSPLDGVTCTVKDVVDIAGLPTRRGSRTTDPAPMAHDAPLVTALRAAGAVLIGKTTTPEYGWKSTGDCPLHGISRNPRSPAHTPGGSSAGAAAAAAAGFGVLHFGTDAGGSTRIPAAWCGVVGLKPSFGRVPQWPHGAFAQLSVAGPIVRTVRDAALMLGAMAGHDWRDPLCLPEPPRDWLHGIEDGVDGLRVAVLRNPGFHAPLDADGIAAVEEAARILGEAGAALEEVEPGRFGLPDTGRLFASLWSAALRRQVSNIPPNRRPWLDPALLALAEATDPTAAAILDAAARQIEAAHAMARLHRGFDLVLCPTVPGPPPLAAAPMTDPVHALLHTWAPWTLTFNLSRQPAIALPLGNDTQGLPRSIQIAAAPFRDDLVLRAARVIERIALPLPPSTPNRSLG